MTSNPDSRLPAKSAALFGVILLIAVSAQAEIAASQVDNVDFFAPGSYRMKIDPTRSSGERTLQYPDPESLGVVEPVDISGDFTMVIEERTFQGLVSLGSHVFSFQDTHVSLADGLFPDERCCSLHGYYDHTGQFQTTMSTLQYPGPATLSGHFDGQTLTMDFSVRDGIPFNLFDDLGNLNPMRVDSFRYQVHVVATVIPEPASLMTFVVVGLSIARRRASTRNSF